MMDRILLDEEQRAAADAPTGPLSILGGPGTGKTLTLIGRAAALLDRGVRPRTIYFLSSSTRRTLEVLRQRSSLLAQVSPGVAAEKASRVRITTINGVAKASLREIGTGALELPPDFAIWEPQETEQVFAEIAAGDWPEVSADEAREMLAWDRFRRSRLPEDPGRLAPSHWHEVVTLYEEEKSRRRALDLYDLMPVAIQAMEWEPEWWQQWRERTQPQLLVDDLQNLTPVEYLFVERFVGRSGSLPSRSIPTRPSAPGRTPTTALGSSSDYPTPRRRFSCSTGTTGPPRP